MYSLLRVGGSIVLLIMLLCNLEKNKLVSNNKVLFPHQYYEPEVSLKIISELGSSGRALAEQA